VEQRVAMSPTLPTPQPLFLGGLATTNPLYFMDGDLAEAVIYSVALDDLARAAVEAYLRVKWGL
jgi:hypothetical protein